MVCPPVIPIYVGTHRVEEARFVSSCLSCPSSARPHLSLLLASSGVSVYTLFRVEPEPNGKPSLKTGCFFFFEKSRTSAVPST